MVFEKRCSNLLKSILVKNNVDYTELVKKLETMGITETYSSIVNKINRGKFSMLFFIQCMEAIGVHEVRL